MNRIFAYPTFLLLNILQCILNWFITGYIGIVSPFFFFGTYQKFTLPLCNLSVSLFVSPWDLWRRCLTLLQAAVRKNFNENATSNCGLLSHVYVLHLYYCILIDMHVCVCVFVTRSATLSYQCSVCFVIIMIWSAANIWWP